MFEDLRGFLAHLESQKQLLRVKDEVDVKYEIAAGMRKTLEAIAAGASWADFSRRENWWLWVSECRKSRCSSVT
jgi:hypothetical protein